MDGLFTSSQELLIESVILDRVCVDNQVDLGSNIDFLVVVHDVQCMGDGISGQSAFITGNKHYRLNKHAIIFIPARDLFHPGLFCARINLDLVNGSRPGH